MFKDHKFRACDGVDDAPAADDPPTAVPAGPPEPAPIALERPILGPGSSVGNLKQRLTELAQPIYGEKATLWRRLADAERRESARLAVSEEASRRRAGMRGGQPAFPPAMVALPAEPTADESSACVDPLFFSSVVHPLHRRERQGASALHDPSRCSCTARPAHVPRRLLLHQDQRRRHRCR